MHFIRYKARGGTFDPPTQGDTNPCIYIIYRGTQLKAQFDVYKVVLNVCDGV